jgi:hypothetical protein
MSLQEFLYFLFKYSVVLKITMIFFISCKEQNTTFFYIAITLHLCITIYTKVNQHSHTHTHKHTIYCCRKSRLHYTRKQILPNNIMDTLPCLYWWTLSLQIQICKNIHILFTSSSRLSKTHLSIKQKCTKKKHSIYIYWNCILTQDCLF